MTPSRERIWPLFALRALFLGGLLFCTERSLVSAALYAFYLAVTMAVNALNLKFCVDAEQRGMALDYGKARAAGSLAFVLISALLGLLVKRWSYFALIWAGFAVLLLQAAANALTGEALKRQPLPKQRESQQSSMSLPAFLKAEPRFAGFLLGSILLYFAHNTITNYMINIVRNVGGDEETMGYLNAFMAVVEIPVMLLFSPIPSSCGAPIGEVQRFVLRWSIASPSVSSSRSYITDARSRSTSVRRILLTIVSISATSLSAFRRKIIFRFGYSTSIRAIATARLELLKLPRCACRV